MSKNDSDSAAAEEAAMDNANVLNPIIGMSVDDLKKAGLSVVKQAAIKPLAGVGQMVGLLSENAKIAVGTSDLKPDPKDRRFSDDAFVNNPFYSRVAQSWLALERGLHDWVDAAGFDDRERDRAWFLTQLIADAVAPTNFLLGNPSALRRAKETNGKSLVRGAKNWIRDAMNNGGMPNQVNPDPFKVGENLAATAGSVVLEHPVVELIQYSPSTEKVRSRPILIAPPQINKFYVYDLSPEKSMVKFLVDQGFQVYMISWRNPTKEERDWGLAEYIDAIEASIDAVCAISRQAAIDVVGACAGGISMTAALAYLSSLGRGEKVSSLSLMVSVLEPRSDDTAAGLFMNDDVIEAARKRSSRMGVLDGKDTARVFSWMRPNDLIWNYVANNYLHGNQPPAFDMLYWNADTTCLPARLHSDFLNVFKDSPFRNSGAMMIRDVPLDIGNVKCPVFITGGTTDHITPWQACYRSTQLFPGETTFVLSTAGHIQSLINPPGSSKRRYLTNSETPTDPEDWLQDATEHKDSWWPYWADWLRNLSARELKATGKLGNKDFPPLRAAPGQYVHE